jgi:predicted ABC-type ATPase
MPYFITDTAEGCSGWATIKDDGEVIGCHTTKQDAIDQMIAVSLAEDMEPGGERALNDELKVGDYVFWDNAGHTMFGEIMSVSTFGAVKNPLGGDIVATQGRPLATIQVYILDNGVLIETSEFVVKGFAPLTKMDYEGQDEIQDDMEDNPEDTPDDQDLERAIDQDAPAYMRAAARRGLEYYADGKGGDGLVEKTIREARLMADGQVSDDKWVRTAAWIARHLGDLDSPDADPNSDNYPSAGVVAHLLWGSGPSKARATAAMEYAQRVAERIANEERHLTGKHDQKSHGSGGKSAGINPQAGQGNIKITSDMAADFQGGSAAPHLRQKQDGSYEFTPERQALHDKIVSDAVAGVPTSADPTYYVMGGGPAAGKSTMLKDSKVSIPSKDKAVQVNPDDVKEKLPEWDRMQGDTNRAAYTHEESSYISKRIQAAAFETKRDVVADGTGDSSVTSMSNKIKKARDANYKVVGNYATVPTSVAIDRANARGARTGRFVPESVIRSTHVGVSDVLPKIVNQFDEINLFDTTGDLILLASGKNGKFTVNDQDGYSAFLAKAGE